MLPFFNQKRDAILFVKYLTANDGGKAYDDAQLIVEYDNGIVFIPLWNIKIKQTKDKEFILDFKR
ncbi:hypothetical protein [Apilactobacillus zhangqiuensis]|uniref:hypothetical protein n=1 Tax=Apilactobacillus zhangqiuensis TaxID=2841031 RepID=UPI001C7CC9A2|nr:hypothetical protein [Apilactobacillus zhangqiuensis]